MLEFQNQRIDLVLSFSDGGGAVDDVIGQFTLLVDGHLRGNPFLGIVERQSARHQALDLLFRKAPAHDDAIEVFLGPGFEDQRGVFKGKLGPLGALERGKPVPGYLLNARVHNLIQPRASGRIGEDDRA